MDPSVRTTAIQRPLPDGKGEIPISSFMYLFAGIVQYYQNHSDSATQLEASLHRLGLSVGPRALELLVFRDGRARRPPSPSPSPLPLLQWILQHFWRTLFPHPPGSLERSPSDPNEYYIPDPSPLTNIFASPAADDSASGLGGGGAGGAGGSVGNGTGSANCAAFIAGVLQGALMAAGAPCDVSAVWTGAGPGSSGGAGSGGAGGAVGAGEAEVGEETNETVYVVKFLPGDSLMSGGSIPPLSPQPGQRSLGPLPE